MITNKFRYSNPIQPGLFLWVALTHLNADWLSTYRCTRRKCHSTKITRIKATYNGSTCTFFTRTTSFNFAINFLCELLHLWIFCMVSLKVLLRLITFLLTWLYLLDLFLDESVVDLETVNNLLNILALLNALILSASLSISYSAGYNDLRDADVRFGTPGINTWIFVYWWLFTNTS